MAGSNVPRTSWSLVRTPPGEHVMSKRSYLDLTPTELLARQHVVWGLGLFAIPALLTRDKRDWQAYYDAVVPTIR